MRRHTFVAVIVALAFSLAIMAGTCDVETKQIKLSDLAKKLKKYEGTKWDGLKKKKVVYAVSGNAKVDEFSKQAGLIYASFIQADYVSDQLTQTIKKLKEKKNKKTKDEAQENLEIAQEILQEAIDNAPKVYKAGEDLVKNASSLISDPTKLPQVIEALKQALENLKKVMDDGPDLVKKLTKQGKQLANL